MFDGEVFVGYYVLMFVELVVVLYDVDLCVNFVYYVELDFVLCECVDYE